MPVLTGWIRIDLDLTWNPSPHVYKHIDHIDLGERWYFGLDNGLQGTSYQGPTEQFTAEKENEVTTRCSKK